MSRRLSTWLPCTAKSSSTATGAAAAPAAPTKANTDIDVEVTIDLLFAPVYYRLLLGHETLDERFAAASVRHLITGLRRVPGA